ncbi:MAG: hypothetical protein Q9219_001785 [cf. Caloplaca sp. 3 TL-2023]
MKTLWSRITRSQTRRTQCSNNRFTRSSSTTLITRRSTTAPAQRRLRFQDACTAFFSTVLFASAAVADSKRKLARQEQWIKAIQEAKDDLTALKADQERRVSILAKSVQPTLFSPYAQTSRPPLQTWEEVFTWAERELSERRALGYESWHGMPLNVLREASPLQIKKLQTRQKSWFHKFNSPPDSEIWNTITWPLHVKKTRTLEWSIAYLSLRMLQMLSRAPMFKGHSSSHLLENEYQILSPFLFSPPDEQHSRLQDIFTRLCLLSKDRQSDEYYEHFDSPEYPRYTINTMDQPDASDQLNANLYAVIKSYSPESENTTRLLLEVCYHLLTSISPPNIHTYNLLITEFAGRKQEQLIGYLLESIKRSHLRPNELTLAEALRHYVRTHNRDAFDRLVRSMDGFDRGLARAHPYKDIPKLLTFQYRVHVRRIEHNGGRTDEYYEYAQLSEYDISALRQEASIKVIEKSRRNLDVYQALIDGTLFFHGSSDAMKHFCAMSSEGWEPNKEILLSILQRCLKDGDWDAGVATWRRLQRYRSSLDDRVYLLMLQLCQKSNEFGPFRELLQNGTRQGALPPTDFEMGWHLWYQDLENQDLNEALSIARDVCILEQRLEDLILQQRASAADLPAIIEHVKIMSETLITTIECPSPRVIALLHEAHTFLSHTSKMVQLCTGPRETGIQSQSSIYSATDIIQIVFLSKRRHVLERYYDFIASLSAQLDEDIDYLNFHIKTEKVLRQYQTFRLQPFVSINDSSHIVARSVESNFKALKARITKAVKWTINKLQY